MKLVRTICRDLLPESGCVLTIGNFDGVHLGHQSIVSGLVAKAQAMNLPAVLVTFAPSPQAYFLGEKAAPVLSSITSRYIALHGAGIDTLVALPFNRSLATTTAMEFIKRYIVEGLHTKHLFVGDDFRFGAGRQGSYQMLCDQGQQFGFSVERVDTIYDSSERISSTRIRDALAEGDLPEAARLMGRNYSMTGKVAHGDKRGRQWGFPTLNLPLRKKPALRGVFSVVVHLDDGSRVNGVANLGNRPTVDGLKTLLEVHLFDFSSEIYGRRICVEFIDKIRDEKKFDSFDALKQQIMADCETARASFNAASLDTDRGQS
jgi:riboflavin kinase/FMN adenylyltransferase